MQSIQPDHLGSPRVVIDATSNTPVWTWELAGEAFGATPPNQGPDGNGQPFVLNMRFPGQRYDAATGLNYNYFRDYESATGRYVQSDPVGLKGAINTYTYASSSPLTFLDFAGLAHTTGFSNSNLDRAAQNALAEAREKIRKCKMEECYDGLEAHYMTEEDRRYIMEKLITMTVVYNPTLRECGYAPQFQSEYVEIGPLSFHPSCCLAGTLAHEASHLGRNWGNGRGSEERSEYIEEKCFGCTGGWR